MKIKNRDLIISATILAAFQLLMLIRLSYPSTPSFDEGYYVSAAGQFLHHDVNENWSHPPLAKLLMAAGMAFAGEGPLGWRIIGTLFGTLTVAGMAAFAWALFGSPQAALWTALFCVFNQVIFVQSRIAMLDTYMFGFTSWSLAALAMAIREGGRRKRGMWVIAASALLGLATCCKWSAAAAWPLGAAILVIFNKRETILSWGRLLIAWTAPFVTAYLLPFLICIGMIHPSFAPPLGPPAAAQDPGRPLAPLERPQEKPSVYGIGSLMGLQTQMLEAQVGLKERKLEYISPWWSWPLMERPVWYFSETGIDDFHEMQGRGVVLLGNPLIQWGGALGAALMVIWLPIHALRRGKRSRARIKPQELRAGWIVLAFYLLFAFCWAVLPRKSSFYYYYYPAATLLSLVWTWWLLRLPTRLSRWVPWAVLAVCAALFAFFYPILTGLQLPIESIQRRIWLSTWV
ncbi:MAG: phospholipid carrier-dependent glycosyltransferase [Bdellovibrionota bacterium]